MDNFELIASLIREQQEEQQQLYINNIQKALGLLNSEYKLRLLEDDFDSAIDVLSNSKKALSFISLISNVQDRQIERYAIVQLLVKEDNVLNIQIIIYYIYT